MKIALNGLTQKRISILLLLTHRQGKNYRFFDDNQPEENTGTGLNYRKFPELLLKEVLFTSCKERKIQKMDTVISSEGVFIL